MSLKKESFSSQRHVGKTCDGRCGRVQLGDLTSCEKKDCEKLRIIKKKNHVNNLMWTHFKSLKTPLTFNSYLTKMDS